MKHFKITISGKVQGVFYRQQTFEMATQLWIKGLVKNLADGSVYIEAEGTSEQLNQLIEWCKTGPPRAKVSDVKFAEGDLKNFSAFEIIR